VLFPLARRQSETVSLGYVTARMMESVFAAIGIMSMLPVVSVMMDWAERLAPAPRPWARKATPSCTPTSGRSSEDAGLVAGIGNGLMLSYLMYRSALVPPRMALLVSAAVPC
jgi:hypothetical protein